MKLVAVITEDREVKRILGRLGLPTAFPTTRPARAPPLPHDGAGEGCQIDPRADDRSVRGRTRGNGCGKRPQP